MRYTVTWGGMKCHVYGYEPTEYISNYLARGEFYETPLLNHIFKHYTGKLKSVVDVGANIGNHTVFFRDVMGVKDIACFEPNAENYRRLSKSAPYAWKHQVALSNAEGTVSSVEQPHNMGASYCTDGGDIECATLDSFDLAPDLIKIDAENMEARVLAGAVETIKKHQPILFVEHNDIQHFYDFGRVLETTGVKYVVRPFLEKTWEMFEYIPEGKVC
jgi:FkbM family methyltransferase